MSLHVITEKRQWSLRIQTQTRLISCGASLDGRTLLPKEHSSNRIDPMLLFFFFFFHSFLRFWCIGRETVLYMFVRNESAKWTRVEVNKRFVTIRCTIFWWARARRKYCCRNTYKPQLISDIKNNVSDYLPLGRVRAVIAIRPSVAFNGWVPF